MRWAGHVASIVRGEVQRVFWWENLMERTIGKPRLRRMILKYIFKKLDKGHRLN
jgi:hypothetical protein